MKLEEMRPHQDCYDLVGRRLTFLAPVGKEALVQSWHLEESHWHEHGHTMEEMRAVEGPIWLTDPAKLYSKPPVEEIDGMTAVARQTLQSAEEDLARKKRELTNALRAAEAALFTRQNECDRAMKALALRGVDVAGFLAGELGFTVENTSTNHSFDAPKPGKLWGNIVLKIDASGACSFCIGTWDSDRKVELFRTWKEAQARVREIIADALAKPYRHWEYGRDRLEEAAVEWGVPIPEKWAAEKAQAEQQARNREQAQLEARLQKLAGAAP